MSKFLFLKWLSYEILSHGILWPIYKFVLIHAPRVACHVHLTSNLDSIYRILKVYMIMRLYLSTVHIFKLTFIKCSICSWDGTIHLGRRYGRLSKYIRWLVFKTQILVLHVYTLHFIMSFWFLICVCRVMAIYYHGRLVVNISLSLVESSYVVLGVSHLIPLMCINKRHLVSITQYRRPLEIDVGCIMVLEFDWSWFFYVIFKC